MRIEMDTFHPANTDVHLTHSEVIHIAMNMESDGDSIILRYMDMDYEVAVAEYISSKKPLQGRVVRI